MRLVAQQIVDEHAVIGERGIVLHLPQRLRGQGKQLGPQEGRSAACPDGQALDAGQQGLGIGVRAVLVLAHSGIGVHAFHAAADIKIAADGGAGILRDLSLAFLPAPDRGFRGGVQIVEGRNAVQDIVQVPHPLRIHFTARFGLLHGIILR